jgi:predicted lipoprotein
MNKIPGFLLILIFLFSACSTENEDKTPDNEKEENSFDREAMLVNWADNIILPAFQNFESSTRTLEEQTTAFIQDPSVAKLEVIRSAFRTAYLDFQSVSMFEIGKAEQLNYRNFLNTYPANTTNIREKIETGSYNLELPSSYAEQGFPALDFLINGLGANEAEIVSFYTENPNASAYKSYLEAVSTRINALTMEVSDSWHGDYRDTFVNNTSSSSTGAVDKFTNDYVMYFEKFLRSGKIGYPAGAFTGEPSPQNTEAYYANDFSKELYLKALESVQDFFNGVHFDGSSAGKSYKQYLDYLDSIKEGANLGELINLQFDTIKAQADSLDASLKEQVRTNNTPMLEAFDLLQMAVVLLKVDMMQALSISVDYVDSDGD